jgi:hypothetical protein
MILLDTDHLSVFTDERDSPTHAAEPPNGSGVRANHRQRLARHTRLMNAGIPARPFLRFICPDRGERLALIYAACLP